MNEYSIREIENYIKELENVKSSFEEADEHSYECACNTLIEKLIEIINIYEGIIPEIKDLILLKHGTEYRDVESVIGKLKWHVLLERNNNNEIYHFIDRYINRLKTGVDIYSEMEIELFDEIAIVINILDMIFQELKM